MGFKEYLQEHKKNLQYDEDLTQVWDRLEHDLPKPKKQINSRKLGLSFLMIILLGSIGYFLSQKEEKRILEPNNTLFADLDPKSTSEKIIAIHNVVAKENLDFEVAEALIYSLKNDQSVNVKMAAVRGLKKYMAMESVRIAVIEELENSDNAYLKIKLIALLKNAKVEEGIPVLDKIIEEKNGYLREEALKGKESILTI